MSSVKPSELQTALLVGRHAAELGFDWEFAAEALEKVSEEVEELREAMLEDDREHIAEELGDLYFAVCNVARKLELDPDEVLASATSKFEYRFQKVLSALDRAGLSMGQLPLDELERYWQAAK